MTTLLNSKCGRDIVSACLDVFHKVAIYPRRMTWIRQNHCYICNVTGSKPCITTYLKNADRNKLMGYIACSKCVALLPILFKVYEETGEYVPNSIYEGVDLSEISFLRHSRSKPSLPIYTQVGKIDLMSHVPLIHIHNRIRVAVSWKETNSIVNMFNKPPLNIEELTKGVFLANVIFYNRNVYGNTIADGPLIRAVDFWRPMIDHEYNRANQFMEFLLCMNRDKTYGLKVDKLIENLSTRNQKVKL